MHRGLERTAAAVLCLCAAGLAVFVGASLCRGEATVPPPSGRIDQTMLDLVGEVRALQRRVVEVGEAARGGGWRMPARNGENPDPLERRVAVLETRVGDCLARWAAIAPSASATRLAVGRWEDMLHRSTLPLQERVPLYSRLASVGNCGAFVGPRLGAAWLRDAQLLSGQPGLAGHLIAARHLAPADAQVRSFLITTALTTPDEELRSRALLGLGHCVWSNDVRDAMKLIVATSGSESARREADNWLRTRAIEESNER
jgi:hypothetical protein